MINNLKCGCGGEVSLEEDRHYGYYEIRCSKCEMSISHDTREGAIDAFKKATRAREYEQLRLDVMTWQDRAEWAEIKNSWYCTEDGEPAQVRNIEVVVLFRDGKKAIKLSKGLTKSACQELGITHYFYIPVLLKELKEE